MTSIYIHIPFCVSKCHYCDFNSYADKSHLVARYQSALLKEISSFANGQKINTIFFGGGTPSYLPPEQIDRLLQQVKQSFDCSKVKETTLETNPETIEDTERFIGYRKAGINRISLGAQSFDNTILLSMNRPHKAEKIPEVLHYAREAGFDNMNLDFIFGYPQQTMETWQDTLEKAIELHPEHLSIYGLTVEPGTFLYTYVKQGKQTPAHDDLVLEMYQYTLERLPSAGYQQYEISNFSLPGRECQHNINYWKNGDYFGFGAGAHSYINGRRYWNIRSVDEYVKRMESGQSPAVGEEQLDGRYKMAESAMLALRLNEGLNRATFQAQFQQDPLEIFSDVFSQYSQAGLLHMDDSRIQLTQQGLYLSDSLFADLFV